MVLEPGPQDWEFSVLTIRPMKKLDSRTKINSGSTKFTFLLKLLRKYNVKLQDDPLALSSIIGEKIKLTSSSSTR